MTNYPTSACLRRGRPPRQPPQHCIHAKATSTIATGMEVCVWKMASPGGVRVGQLMSAFLDVAMTKDPTSACSPPQQEKSPRLQRQPPPTTDQHLRLPQPLQRLHQSQKPTQAPQLIAKRNHCQMLVLSLPQLLLLTPQLLVTATHVPKSNARIRPSSTDCQWKSTISCQGFQLVALQSKPVGARKCGGWQPATLETPTAERGTAGSAASSYARRMLVLQ